MKTLTTIFLLSMFTVTYSQDTLTILHLNDTHSMLAPLAPRNSNLQGTRGGVARAASFIGLNKISEPNVLTLHAGDFFIGDLFFNTTFGAAELQILANLGVDAMAVGNHEFDLTPFILEQSLTAAFASGGFPLLSANLNLSNDSVAGLRNFIKPYTVKQIGNIKVGIFGLTTPETNIFSQPLPAFVEEDFISAAATYIDTLSAQNCHVIICLSHLGLYFDKLLAVSVPGIDVIVGGHDHHNLEVPVTFVNPSGKPTHIVQTGGGYQSIGKLKLLVTDLFIFPLSYENINLDSSIPEEPSVKTLVDTLIVGIEALYGPVYSQQIGVATDYFKEVADSLYLSGNHETAIGNFVADAYRWKTGCDVAIQVGGSTAQPIYAGPVVSADLFRVVGYGFNEVNGLGYRLCKFNMTGEALMMGLEVGLSQLELNDEFLPQVSGMSYSYDISDTVMRLRDPRVNGVPVNPLQIYSVAANEFLLAAMSLFEIPFSDVYVYNDSSEFQVLVDYTISLNGILTPKYENRLTLIERIPASAPMNFKLYQNYPNPFNPNTIIQFEISSRQSVSLKVFDLLGEEVATLVDEELLPGAYRTEFNTKDFQLASGIYFYRLQAGKYIETKKMVLVR